MNHTRNIKIGAIAWGLLGFFSVALPTLHELPDLILTIYKQNDATIQLPEGFSFPYLLAGIAFEPIMIVCLILFGYGFLSIWNNTRLKISLVTTIIIFVYAITRTFWGWVEINYAQSIEVLIMTNNWEEIASADIYKGLGAGINGIVAGTLSVSLVLFFIRINESISGSNLGKNGGLIVMATLIPSIVIKTLSLWYYPYIMTGIFSILMTLKSFGIGLIAIEIYRQSNRFSTLIPKDLA